MHTNIKSVANEIIVLGHIIFWLALVGGMFGTFLVALPFGNDHLPVALFIGLTGIIASFVTAKLSSLSLYWLGVIALTLAEIRDKGH